MAGNPASTATPEALVGPEGVLPAKMTRPLLAVSQSGVLRALIFCPLRAGYTLARMVSGARAARGPEPR